MAAKDPGVYIKGVIERAEAYNNIEAIYDLGPNYDERYTIITGAGMALVISEKPDVSSARRGWKSQKDLHGSLLGTRIYFHELPSAVREYLHKIDLLPAELRREKTHSGSEIVLFLDIQDALNLARNISDALRASAYQAWTLEDNSLVMARRIHIDAEVESLQMITNNGSPRGPLVESYKKVMYSIAEIYHYGEYGSPSLAPTMLYKLAEFNHDMFEAIDDLAKKIK